MLFEHAEDPTRELCRIERVATRVTVHHYLVGQEGRATAVDYATFEEARAAYDRQIVEVYERGYRLVRDWVDPPLRFDATLEAMIAEDPYDESRWMVLADWILTQDDVRAQIVRFEQTRTSREESETWGQYPVPLFGGTHEASLLTDQLAKGRWQAGHVQTCKLELSARYGGEMMDAFAIAPATRLVRELSLEPADLQVLVDALGRLAGAPCRPVLRRLALDVPRGTPVQHLAPIFDAKVATQLATLELRLDSEADPTPILDRIVGAPILRTLRELGVGPASLTDLRPLYREALPGVTLRTPSAW